MITLKKLENGFEYIEVENQSAHAKIALQGAHIFHFARHHERPILWLSQKSDFKKGVAIRGGVPICWPAFAKSNPDLPQHGFARTAMWTLGECQEIDAHTTEITLILRHNQERLKLWHYKFELCLSITISDQLTMALKTTNLDTRAMKLTQALHSYFDVGAISDVRIKGLDQKPYHDSLKDQEKVQEGDLFITKEVDVIYQKVDKRIQLITKDSILNIDNSGSSSLVVWNPWREKCKHTSGMSEGDYLQFVCIESANAREDFRIIPPGGTHILSATISKHRII